LRYPETESDSIFVQLFVRCLQEPREGTQYDKGVTVKTWVDFWCKQKLVHYPRTRSCRRDTAPTKSYNPSGPIQSCEVYWSQDELDVFRGLGVPKEKRESTYLAAYLSCWLCVFALPETKDWLIHPETFETASLMASGCKFSLALAVPVLASLYHGLNGIAYAVKCREAFVLTIILFVPLSFCLACTLLPDTSHVASFSSGPSDGVVLWPPFCAWQHEGCPQADT